MGTNIATAAISTALIPAAVQAAVGKEYSDEEVRRLVAANQAADCEPHLGSEAATDVLRKVAS